MANILSLAMKINADASGFKLDPVQRALQGLAAEADKVSKVFDEFTGTSEAAARAQAKTAAELERLTQARRAGTIGAKEFAEQFAAVAGAANQEAAALRRAAQITEQNLTPAQRYSKVLAELDDQLKAGRISQETYDRALAKAKTNLDGAASAASKTDKSIESLTKNTQLLARIEIGRLLLDGLQAVSGVISSVTNSVTSLVTSVNSSLDTLNDFSARTGIGVEALQGYSLAAKLAGVDTEAFGAAVQKLGVNIGKAAPGDAFDKSLRSIGLSVTELRSLAPEQQFAAIGEAISALPTAADRAAASVAVFGQQGAALAPLFREGAASIDELRERAERLGIIVDETQINNIGDMNDTFDLVSATINGIIGQIVGNLAPAVTAVVDEFLKFIETWEGAEGTGGTGIANAITKVLLTGAEALAGIFDYFVGNFKDFGVTFTNVANVFQGVANTFIAVGEVFRTIFNYYQLLFDGLKFALGAFLEFIGSWIDSDLEEAGRKMREAAAGSAKINADQLVDAAKGAAQAVSNVLTGDSTSAQAAGQQTATDFFQGIRERFEREQSPEFKINTNIEETRERFDSFFGGIIDQSSAVVEPMREFEAAVAAAQADGELTADEIARIEELQAKVNASLDQELAARQEIADTAAKQSEEVDKLISASLEQMRVDNEFGGDSSRAKAAENVLKLEQEAIRVEEQLRLARDAGDQAAIDAATRRLAQLDQVAARERDIASGQLEINQRAAEAIDKVISNASEFGDAVRSVGVDFAFAMEEAARNFDDGLLSREQYDRKSKILQKFFAEQLDAQTQLQKAAQQEQFDAQLAFQNAVEEARRKFEAGIFNEEAFNREVERQQKLYDRRAKLNEQLFDAENKLLEAQFEIERDRAEQLSTLRGGSIEIQDLRDGGIGAFFETLQEDPAIAEARKQRQELEKIRKEIAKLNAERVEILGGTG